MLERNGLYLGDCLELMKEIPDKSVDMILCDLPYGVLNKNNSSAKWDCVLPFDTFWGFYKRIIKDNGCICLFAQGMFTARLLMSNPGMWRYNLVWKKGYCISGFLNANRQPLRNHEDICIFSKGQTVYNPQMTKGEKNHSKGGGSHKNTQRCYGKFIDTPTTMTDEKYPISILDFPRDKEVLHPTQKPVALLKYLIKTYTNRGGLVLDNCMGSGSTCVAALLTERDYIGIEKEKEYYDIACKRIEDEIEL